MRWPYLDIDLDLDLDKTSSNHSTTRLLLLQDTRPTAYDPTDQSVRQRFDKFDLFDLDTDQVVMETSLINAVRTARFSTTFGQLTMTNLVARVTALSTSKITMNLELDSHADTCILGRNTIVLLDNN